VLAGRSSVIGKGVYALLLGQRSIGVGRKVEGVALLKKVSRDCPNARLATKAQELMSRLQ